ncbi:MAG TPA: glycosyltransferase [Geminicoccus sp.]|jgi:glycosyltransferase involved in cell wall biosynthesis|uniref:glycosyltransferase n=1 Tax=Geminicoccus sp. TaxID=2024832 RepID=UPI002E381F6E|nr:glycosyltransferase [Geminicoccus sp.]HEX2527210.1 glycosyltransferase [Geminicoccus sp.]
MVQGKSGLPMTMEVEPTKETFRITIVYGRLPLPMKRADQMTVAHLIAFLKARGHQVDLLTLDDGEALKPEHESWLKAHCRKLTILPQGKRRSLIGMAQGLAKKLPLQVGWFSNPQQREAVRDILAKGEADVVYCYTIRGAESIRGLPRGNAVTFLAMQVSQSLNTRRMMETFTTLRDKLIFSTESKLVRRYEAHVWQDFDRVVLIGEADVEEVKQACREYGQPEVSNWVFGAHGVDITRYVPRGRDVVEPNTLVFSGAMGTNTNANAAIWFAGNVFEKIRAAVPDARLLIVGRNPRPSVQALGSRPGITVTGEVPDPADYIARAAVCVNPVMAGAGMQNKLLEFLAMAKPTVATTVANEGIRATPGEHLIIADKPDDFAREVVALLKDEARASELGQAARRYVEQHWTWEAHWLELETNMLNALKAKRGTVEARPLVSA